MGRKQKSQAEIDAFWHKTLTEGHQYIGIARRLFRHLPSAPRCKLCYNPFGGVGGKALGLIGFSRSRYNPNVCAFCCERLPPGGAELDIGVLFADIRGSTELGERMEPGAYAALLNRFYNTATAVLIKHDAIIDKLIGDEVMALFIPGIAGPGYRRRAAAAGEALLRAMGYGGSKPPWLPLGVGVHAGVAYVGNVGGEDVMDFTALGDTVNTTARLQAAAAAGEVLLSDELWDSLEPRDPEPERRLLTLRGKTEPVPVRVLRP